MASTTSGGLMKSIFGGGPQALTNQRYATIRSEADDIINTTNKIQSPGEAIGGAFGTPFGKEFAGEASRILLGDPEMELAEEDAAAFKAINEKYEQDDPKRFYAIADYANSKNKYTEGAQAFKQGAELEKAQTKARLKTASNLQVADRLKELGYPDRADRIEKGLASNDEIQASLNLAQKLYTRVNKLGDKEEVLKDAGGNVTKVLGVVEKGKTVIKESTTTPGKYIVMSEMDGKIINTVDSIPEAQREQERVTKVKNALMKTNKQISILDNIEKLVKDGGSGFEYDLFKEIPGTNSRALAGEIDTIKANLSFDALAEIRNNKTGGGLGSITERELDLLGSTISALDPGLSEEDFLIQVNRIRTYYNNIIKSSLGEEVKINYKGEAYKDYYRYDKKTEKMVFLNPVTGQIETVNDKK